MQLGQLTPTDATNIEERNRFPKLKLHAVEMEERANKILSERLKNNEKIVEITDAVCAIRGAVTTLLNVKVDAPDRRKNVRQDEREETAWPDKITETERIMNSIAEEQEERQLKDR